MALTANTVLSSTATSKFLSLISHFFPNRYVFSPGPTIAMFWYLRFQNSISSHYPPSKNLSFPGGRSRCSASGIVPLPSSSIDDWASRSLVKWLISVKPPWDFWDHECTINDNLDITYIPMLMIENGRRFLCFVVIYIYNIHTYTHKNHLTSDFLGVFYLDTCFRHTSPLKIIVFFSCLPSLPQVPVPSLFRDFLRSKMNGSGTGVYFPAACRKLSQDFEHISNQMAHFLLKQGLKTGQAG